MTRLARARGFLAQFAVVLVAAVLALAAVAASPSVANAQADATPRYALVIGIGSYRSVPHLPNAVSDAQLMAGVLAEVGFDVTTSYDPDKQTFETVLRDFRRRIEKGSIVFVYYSGHGIQVDDENYLIPVDAELTDVADLSISSVSARALLDQLEAIDSTANILILDACRDNPFRSQLVATRSTRGGSVEPGLAPLRSQHRGTLIGFSTAPGSVAFDGTGSNSPYTAALAANLRTPGASIEAVFKQTRSSVLAATDNAQVPWENSSLTSDVVLVPGGKQFSAQPTACDLLAGHPSDPKRVGPGIDYALLAPGPAIEACQRAVADAPAEPRFKMLLARALEKAGNYEEAIAYNRLAMAEDYLAAYHNMGNHYKKGAGVPKDPVKAMELFLYAAERGHPEDQYNVGVMRLNGDTGIEVDYREALKWLTASAKQDYASAFDKLGLMFQDGKGVPQDQVRANQAFARGAELGDASSMVNLARSYREGTGIEQDFEKARELLMRAARLGRTSAYASLGDIYRKGQGIAANPLEAVVWYRLAARDGNKNALKQLPDLEAKLSDTDRAEVERRLQEWDTKRFG